MVADPDDLEGLSLPPPPRVAAFSWTGRMYHRVILGTYLAMLVVGLALAAQQWQHADAIDSAATATARILAKEKPANRPRTHYVRFAFTPEGAREIEITTLADPDQYDSVSVGQERPVRYLPEDAAGANWLFGYEEARQRAYKKIAIYLFSCFLPPLLLVGVFEWLMWRERDLARRGELATGCITSASITRGRGRTKIYWIRFSFALPSGDVVQGRSKVTKTYFESKGRPGEAVLVLWDPRRPRRCQALPGLWFTAFPGA
jgi:hypothetical protein